MRSSIRQAIGAAKEIAAQPWCALSSLFLFYMGMAAVDKYLLEGRPVSGALQWVWDAALTFPQRPLVQLLMIPLALWMFGHGINKVLKAQKADRDLKIAAEEARRCAEEANKRETQALFEASKLPSLFAKAWIQDKLVERVTARREKFSTLIKQYHDALTSLSSSEDIQLSYLQPWPLKKQVEDLENFLSISDSPVLGKERFAVKFELQKPTPVLQNSYSGDNPVLAAKSPRKFRGDENERFLSAHRENLKAAEDAFAIVEKLERRERQNMSEINAVIERTSN